jgi:transposase
MNEKNIDEIRYRRQAFRFFERGKSPVEILAHIPRSRAWLFKWKQRFEEQGWAALDSLPRTPLHSPQAYLRDAVQWVVRIRRRLEKQTAGQVSARAIQQELRRRRLLSDIPSESTIKRWLQQAGVITQAAAAEQEPYYPALPAAEQASVFSCDWISRYLPGGEKVFAFHTLDLETHALGQSLQADKTAETACAHLLISCRSVGLPDLLRLDNDAAFTGLGWRSRLFGRFVRLALWLGIELLFIPPGEPKRNHDVERVNGLWAQQFWRRNHCRTWRAVEQKTPKFLAWYQTYAPPVLGGLTVAEATRLHPRAHLSPQQIREIPQALPLTAGRLHFVRRVNAAGEIEILKEQWKVSRSLRGEYVLATLDLRKKELFIYYRRSQRAQAHLVRHYEYEIEERVTPLLPEYRRHHRCLDMQKII